MGDAPPNGLHRAAPRLAVGTATQRCIEQIRNAILQGVLLPGQHLKQEALAKELGVSRIPIREALNQLAADGVVLHTPNAGYTVARFDLDELDQLYLMRELIESALLRSIQIVTPDALRELDLANTAIRQAALEGDLDAYHANNYELHFIFFRLGGKPLLLNEVQRLWKLGEFYRALHVYDTDSRFRVLDEHEEMLTAARTGSSDDIVAAFNAHRRAAQSKLHDILSLRAGGRS